MVNLGINNTSFWPNFAILKYKMLAIRWLKTPFQTHNSSSKPTKLANISHFTSITGYNLGAGKLYLPPPTLYLSLSVCVVCSKKQCRSPDLSSKFSSPAQGKNQCELNDLRGTARGIRDSTDLVPGGRYGYTIGMIPYV